MSDMKARLGNLLSLSENIKKMKELRKREEKSTAELEYMGYLRYLWVMAILWLGDVIWRAHLLVKVHHRDLAEAGATTTMMVLDCIMFGWTCALLLATHMVHGG